MDLALRVHAELRGNPPRALILRMDHRDQVAQAEAAKAVVKHRRRRLGGEARAPRRAGPPPAELRPIRDGGDEGRVRAPGKADETLVGAEQLDRVEPAAVGVPMSPGVAEEGGDRGLVGSDSSDSGRPPGRG